MVNLTVPAAHFAVSAAALAAGKHVFSEKPLCAECEQGRMLVTQAERRGLKLGCAPDTFLGAGGRLAREIIDSGRIGKVLSGTCFLMSHGMEHWHPDPEFYFKPGGGPILDMAPYYLAALINLHRAGGERAGAHLHGISPNASSPPRDRARATPSRSRRRPP